jgi:hypothetical protein
MPLRDAELARDRADRTRESLEAVHTFLGYRPHQRIGEACGTDLCMVCLARATVDAALAGSPSGKETPEP